MEYDNCIDCDQYFFDDMKCIFEEGSHDVEDHDKRDDIIDYDVFVLNERNLQKEIARLLIVDAREKPHVTARKVDNLVKMYMELYHRNFAVPSIFERMGTYFRPVVSMKRCIYQLSEKEKTKMQYIYDVNNVAYDSLEGFIDRMKKRNRVAALRPFVATGNENSTMPVTLDSIYHWRFGGMENDEVGQGGEDMIEHARLLHNEAIEMIGLVNIYGNPDANEMTLGDIDTYYTYLKALQVGNNVRIVPHDDIAGLIEETAMVIDIVGDKLALRGVSNTRYHMSLSSIEAVLKASFSITTTEGSATTNSFCKKDFLKGNYLVRFTDPLTAEWLAPTLSEWLYCHDMDSSTFLSVNDVDRALPSGLRKGVSHGAMRHIISRNIHKLKKTLRARKPFAFARRLYRSKPWPLFLTLNNKIYKHDKSSIDTGFHRMHVISQNQLVQTQLLRCIEEDLPNTHLDQQKRQLLSGTSDALDILATKTNNPKNKVALLINAWIKKQKGVRVFASLDSAFYGDGPTEADDKAYVWNEKNMVFIALSVSNRLDNSSLTWAVDISRTVSLVKDVAESDYNASTFSIILDDNQRIIFAHEARNSIMAIIGASPVLGNMLDENSAKAKLKYDHTSFLDRREYNGMNAYEFNDMDGDDDYIDFEHELNNQEFGVGMMRLADNNAYEDDELIEGVEGAHLVRVENTERRRVGMVDVVYRVARIFGIDLDDSQVHFIAQHTNIRTNCDQELAAVKLLEAQAYAEFSRRGYSGDALDAAKTQLAQKHTNKRYAAIYDRVAFHLVGMLCVVVQSALPRVIIASQQQYAKDYGLEGYPLNTNFDTKTTLVGYLTTLMMKVMVEMTEFKSLNKYSNAAEVSEKIQNVIDERILDTPVLVAQLNAARIAHQDFKTKHQHTSDVIKEHSVWTTFRPYFDIKNVKSAKSNNTIAGITAKYIAIVQRIVEKTQPIKLSMDKTPLQVNSCCTQALINSANFWNYFTESTEVKTLISQYRVFFEKVSADNSMHGVARFVHVHPDDMHKRAFREKLMRLSNDNIALISQPEIGINKHISGRVLVAHALGEFLASNPLFKNDVILSAVTELPNDDNAWARLSTQAFMLFGKLSQLSTTSASQVIDTIRNIVLNMDDKNVKSNIIFASTLASFLSYDLKSLFGKLSNDYRVDSHWESKHKFTSTDKINIRKSLVDWLPGNFNSIVTMSDLATLKSIINDACVAGLKHVSNFEPIVRANNGEMAVCYLLLYILAKLLLYIVATYIQYEGDLVSMDISSTDMSEDTQSILASIVEIVISGLIDKHNNNIKIDTASLLYEKSREQGKQQIISFMKSRDSDERELIKEMKERGLVNLLDLSESKFGKLKDSQNTETTLEHIDEQENEIVNDIMNNHGENADDDNYAD